MTHIVKALVILLFTTSLMAQVAAGPRRETVTSPRGTVVFVYAPDGKQIVSVEDDDCITDYIYDDAGVNVGHTVRPRGTNLALTVRYSQDRRFSADGMPSIERVSDENGRDIEIRTSDGTSIAKFLYRRSGHAAEVKIGDRMKLKVSAPASNKVTQTLTTQQGKKIREAIVPGIGFKERGHGLDIVSRELGLGIDWPARIQIRHSASSQLAIVRDAAGNVILYRLGGDVSVGFLPDGTPLFYDIRVEQAARPHLGWGSDAQPDVFTDLSGVVPDHVVFARSGMIGAYVRAASEGAINSMWTERDDAGNVMLRFRSTTKPDAQNDSGTTEEDDARNVPLRDQPVIDPMVPDKHRANSTGSLASLGSTEPVVLHSTCSEPYSQSVCSWGDYVGLSCTFNSGWIEYECGGGGWGGDSWGGGGGGGGTTSGEPNQVKGDPELYAKVERSLTESAEKLSTPNCSALLDTLTYGSNNTPLRSMLNAPGYTSAGDYITQALRFENGFSTGKCNGSNVAYTQVYTTTVYVCSKITQYSDSMGANFLIHEMLHTLGLAENPPTSGAMSSSQITSAVSQACGS